MSDLEEPKPGVSRRTVAKAMAWSVPAVALAVPAPAYAASGPPPDVSVGVACKLPGNSVNQKCADVFAQLPGLDTSKAYAIPLLICNNTSKDIVLKPTIGIESSGLPFNVVGIIPDYCTPIAPTECVKVIVYANSDNSANTAVTLALTVPWGHDCADTDHAPIFIPNIQISSFPPCSSNVPFPTGAPSCDPPFYQ
ncbi:hypothetical protein GCM10009819_16130 [Agromyces tropicus]|uniref:Uncharacterized protein n=1 Tax=Agromyces tropicus TaxID=555371 RepID=A0ABP5FU26_9MICO